MTRERKKMKNYEKIKEMSLAELAEVIMCPHGIPCELGMDCSKCCEAWLMEEAEDV